MKLSDLTPGDHSSDPRQVCLLGALVRCQKPEICVEAGTYRGHAAKSIALALSTNRKGHLHTADPLNLHVDFGDFAPRWVTYHETDFLEMLDGLPAVDFAYIDASAPGSGGAALRWKHFEAVRPKLRPGGIICVDDTAADDWDDGEGGRSVQRIRDACGVNFTFCRGLSVYSC